MNKKEEFLRVFPENLKKYKNLRAIAESYAENFDLEVTSKMELLEIYLKMENQKDETLDKLAWQWDVDFYNSGLPKSQKIDLIKNSLYFNSTKGTKAVLQQALDIVYLGAIVEEWFEYGGDPYCFKVISDKIFDESELKKIIDFVATYKNARSTLETISSKIIYPTEVLVGNTSGYSSNMESGNNRSKFNVASGSYLSSIMKVAQGG